MLIRIVPEQRITETCVFLSLLLFLLCLNTSSAWAETDLADMYAHFKDAPSDCRIMMRWWWFGPAVSRAELERELHAMKDAGIGGVELQPVYALALDDSSRGFHNSVYLSDEFIENLRFAAQKARELGLRFDITLGSGWPYGGPHIPVTQAAGKLRVVSVHPFPETTGIPVPDLAAGEQLLAVFLAAGEQGARRQMLELDKIRDGRLPLPPSAHPRTVTWFISSRTGMMVKRAAIGAEGFVLDHFETAAVENHLRTVGDRLLTAFASDAPYSVFSDSLEVYGSDWTSDLLQQFQKRRGYDLKPHLFALVRDIGEEAEDIRHDWGRTLNELINERYLTPVREWAAQHGTRFRSQTYGIPAVSLSSNRLVDLPEGEGDNWRGFAPSRWASSASHLYQRNITSAETWTWLHSPAFRATPLDMKADADRFFLQGINQIVGHGWPYSSPGIPEPGWSFYAAGAFNDHNPWWPVMPELSRYLQRISYLLRLGKPANDVALLLPTDDAWAQFTAGNDSVSESMERLLGPDVIPAILDSGYNFDFIDAEAVDKVGIPYPVLILPGTERLPAGSYRQIEKYAEGGGIVIATRTLPSRAPGMIEASRDSARVRNISQELFQGGNAKGHFLADEHQLSAALAHLHPDISVSPKAPDLGFVHRTLPFADIYFLVNTGNRKISGSARFRGSAQNAEWWDAFSGEISPAGSAAAIELTLEPYESRVLVFSHEKPPPGNNSKASGKERRSVATATIDLAGQWMVGFPELDRTIAMENLRSWSDNDESRFYSGRAIYEKTFRVSAPVGKRVYLDFSSGVSVEPVDRHSRFFAGLEGPIREAAQIFVNDQAAGSLWKPPYRAEVTKLLRGGENRLRIVVYNTAINVLAGRAPADYRLLNSRYGLRFTPQDVENLQPLPSGLLREPRLLIEDGP